jgi:uncharacterized protein DUF5682
MPVHFFGIRHHGPGSARSLREALEALAPDAVLVEGPPDAAAVLPLLVHEEMRPPVALLVYAPEHLQHAVYYPFAVFSPEWQALHYGLSRDVEVRFIDLPQANRFAKFSILNSQFPMGGEPSPEPEDAGGTPALQPEPPTPERLNARTPDPRLDPVGWLAQAAGYSDGERWWEHLVEHRRNSTDLFAAILEGMTVLRAAVEEHSAALSEVEEAPRPLLPLPIERRIEALREASMRQAIRAVEREGFERIVVVCGAWHAPALAGTLEKTSAKEDAALLRGLPKVKVQATWVPWTHGRLALASGYGAGIESPGWYHHLWTTPDQTAIHWMIRVARLLRGEDLDASSAHIIEAVRLAEALASVRDRPLPGLAELNEATQAVLCFGDGLPMRLIHEKLIVGEALGEVPDETPMVPLQEDLRREQRRLRLPPQASEKVLELDLRKPTDQERSQLLHRLLLLNIRWGEEQAAGGKGTFHENWRLRWVPELSVALIEAAIWGNTVLDAAIARARDVADGAPELPALTSLLDRALLANLPQAITHVMERLEAQAAVAVDVLQLMAALPPLARVARYSNVRQTDPAMVRHIVDGMVARICIGLPGACASLNDEAAGEMLGHIMEVNYAVSLLETAEHEGAWRGVLRRLADQQGGHGLIAGRCCRLLLDAGVFDAAETARRLSLGLSTAVEPPQAAAWVEGLLAGSGLLLLHNDNLWSVLDGWVAGLSGETFTQLLPLLRRTFSTFPAPERRQMGERVRRGPSDAAVQAVPAGFDIERANAVLPLVARLLGLELEESRG